MASLYTIIGIAIVFYILRMNTHMLYIIDQESDDVYFSMPINVGDKLEFNWIHSFEHIPWNEYYQIKSDKSLELYLIEVAGFGAGIPENKGTVTIKNGMITMSELSENFDNISWIHSQTALSSIKINGQIIILGESLPHHKPLRLIIKGRFIK